MADHSMEDAADVGQYGSIRLLKTDGTNNVVAAYPIDKAEVTFGKTAGCDVRLYYPWVSNLHCKIIFDDRKAFLVVLGTNGVIIDDCAVFPSTSTSNPTTVPLSNHSEIEIYKKRFKFSYPPKALRPIQIPGSPGPNATPARRHKMRLSMIQSAQVFTPRGPSINPKENLRILQTPLRSPSKRPQMTPHAEEDVVLVDGNNPEVCQEGDDLIIKEAIENDEPEFPATPTPPAFPISRSLQNVRVQSQLQTPKRQAAKRRSDGASLLHRAVLIRSAQRAAIKWQEEEQDAAEEDEVEKEVSPERELGPHYGGDGDEASSSDEEMGDEEEDQQDEDQGGEAADEDERPARVRMSAWRRSLEAVKGLVFGSPPKSNAQRPDEDEEEYNENEDEQDITELSDDEPFRYDDNGAVSEQQDFPEDVAMDEDEPEIEDQDQDENAPPVAPAEITRLNYNLGGFMTPQGTSKDRLPARRVPRYSYAGPGTTGGPGFGSAQRVRLTAPWKIQDITVPGLPKGQEAHKLVAENVDNDISQDATDQGPDQEVDIVESDLPAPSLSSERKAEKEDTLAMFARMQQTVEGMARRRSSMGITARSDNLSGNNSWARGRMSFSPNKKRVGAFSLLAQDEDEDERLISVVKEEAPPEEDEQMVVNEEGGANDEPRASGLFMERLNSPVDVKAAAEEDDDDDEGAIGLPPFLSPHAKSTHPPMLSIAQMESPKYIGLKEMFRARKSLATPIYEGIGEMLGTPTGYKSAVVPIQEMEDDVAPVHEEVDMNVPKTAPRRVAARRVAAQRTPAEATPSSFADDEQTPAEPAPTSRRGQIPSGVPKGAVVRKSRRKVVEAETHVESLAGSTIQKRGARDVVAEVLPTASNDDHPQPVRATRGKKRIEEKSPLEDSAPAVPVATSEDEVLKAAPAPKTTARRTRKAVTDDEAATEDSTKSAKPKTTRAKKAAESDSDMLPAQVTKAPARRTRAKTTDNSSAAETSGTRRTTRRKAGTTTESESDADPLDSIGPAPVVKTKTRRAPAKVVVEATIVEEPQEDVKPVAALKKKATRIPKAKSQPSGVEDMDKENTPQSSSVEDIEGSGNGRASKARVATTTSRKKAVKTDEEPEVPVVATRATRARTRK